MSHVIIESIEFWSIPTWIRYVWVSLITVGLLLTFPVNMKPYIFRIYLGIGLSLFCMFPVFGLLTFAQSEGLLNKLPNWLLLVLQLAPVFFGTLVPVSTAIERYVSGTESFTGKRELIPVTTHKI